MGHWPEVQQLPEYDDHPAAASGAKRRTTANKQIAAENERQWF
jgi:hypothetical protein